MMSTSPSTESLSQQQQSLSVAAPDWDGRAGESAPRRHPLVADGQFVATYSPDVRTLHDHFESAVERFRNSKYLGTRVKDGVVGDYEWLTYGQVKERVDHFASVIADLPEKAHFGIYSINRLEWIVAEQACYRQNLVTVPLYDTLGDEAIVFIVEQTAMTHVVASREKVAVLSRLLGQLPSLRVVISMDPVKGDVREQFAAKGVQLAYFVDLEARGAADPQPARPPQPLDLCTVCYTSGTTGRPKGVMLSHRAILADAASCLALTGFGLGGLTRRVNDRQIFPLSHEDLYLSYLPLAHIFERVVLTALTAAGASIGFYQGDALKILDDLQALRPTFFASVPRLLNRVHERVRQTVEQGNPISRFLFNMAYEGKLENLRERGELTHWFWDRLVFGKIAARLGGRVRGILSGAAPLSPEVMDFLRVCFGCEVYEGYGQTETSAGTTLTVRGDWTTGHIGVPTPANEIKLVDVPDMDLEAVRDDKGEICVRGLNCFVGYYRDEETTRAAIDADGWVHSGDIGRWDERGRLQIVDRKKNIFKLSQGEYVAPEKVETVLLRSPFVSQCFVYGDSLRSFLVAIIIPHRHAIEDFAVKEGLLREEEQTKSRRNSQDVLVIERLQRLCQEERIVSRVLQDFQQFKKQGLLKGFEVPKAVHLDAVPFSIENQLLSPKFSLKRFQAEKHYRQQLDDLYARASE